jgi:hypothetical protein
MAQTRSFEAKGKKVTITANDDGSLAVKIGDRNYNSLEKFMHLHLEEFQALYPQLEASMNGDSAVWNAAISQALSTLRSAYPITLLRGGLAERDPHIRGANPVEAVRNFTGSACLDLSRSTLTVVQAKLTEIGAAKADIDQELLNANKLSARALEERTRKRRHVTEKVVASKDTLIGLEQALQAREAELVTMLTDLEKAAAREEWEICTKQPDADTKAFKVKIKKAKFRQIVFFSRHRHSIPYFLEPHWTDDDFVFAAGPESKYLNTLTILTANELQSAFEEFVKNVYLPCLNNKMRGSTVLCQFKDDYNVGERVPLFIADKYYGDQGMHCTPRETRGCAFTLSQEEHRFFYVMLLYKRDHDKTITNAHAQLVADGLRRQTPDQVFAQMTVAYPKLLETLTNLHKRCSRQGPTPQIKALMSAIVDYGELLKLQLNL